MFKLNSWNYEIQEPNLKKIKTYNDWRTNKKKISTKESIRIKIEYFVSAYRNATQKIHRYTNENFLWEKRLILRTKRPSFYLVWSKSHISHLKRASSAVTQTRMKRFFFKWTDSIFILCYSNIKWKKIATIAMELVKTIKKLHWTIK